MDYRAGWQAATRHSMRAYYLPVVAGLLLIVSAFLPWIFVGQTPFGGVPDVAGLWILGLGIAAVVLASLSIITRKNSRHPILLVGLSAFGIMFLAYKLMARAIAEGVWATSQARAIVEGGEPARQLPTSVGMGIYLGLAASGILVLFGLTIVFKRVAKPYADPDDDDV